MRRANRTWLHDHRQFEELKSTYILLRNSALSSDYKKHLIVESQGSLGYKEAVANLKLLESLFL